MDTAWTAVGPLITATLILVVCAALVRLGGGRAPVFAFVTFLLLRAGVILFGVTGNLLHGAWTAAAIDTIQALNLAMVPALLAFLAVYPRRTRLARHSWWVVPFLGIGAVLVIYATLDPCAVVCEERGEFGPLYLLTASVYVVEAAGGLALVRRAARSPEGHARTAIHLLALGLLLDATVTSTLSATILSPGPAAVLAARDPDWIAVLGSLVSPVIALAFVGPACALAWRSGLPHARPGVAGIAAVVLAGVIVLVVPSEASLAYPISVALLSLTRLALPLLAALALVRHRLFDIDLQERQILRGAAIGSFFAAIFFLVEQATSNYFGDRFGVIAGVLVSGIALPLTPQVRRLAERTMRLADGGIGPVGKLGSEEKLRLYEEFARDAWADGMLGRSERKFLDDLREHLGIDIETAARAESAAANARSNASQDVRS